MSFTLAVAADSLTRWYTPQRALERIRELGVDTVQLCSTLFPKLMNFTPAEVSVLQSTLQQTGLQGTSFSTFPYQVAPADYIEFLRKIITGAAPALGVQIINTYLFPFIDGQANDERVISSYARTMEPLLKMAATAGLVITIEPECFDPSRNVTGLQRILATVDHPNLKLTYDPCNLYQGNEEAFPYAYQELREHIAHVHLKNGSIFVDGRHPADEKAFAFAAPRDDRCMRWGPMHEGALNMTGIIKQLLHDGYNGAVVLEPHTQSASKQLHFLREEIHFVHQAVKAHRSRGRGASANA